MKKILLVFIAILFTTNFSIAETKTGYLVYNKSKEIAKEIDTAAIGPHKIEVDTTGKKVRLQGHVSSMEDATTVVAIAKKWAKGDEIVNNLTIVPASGSTEAAQRALSKIDQDPDIKAYKVQIALSGDTALLTGYAGTDFERAKIEAIVRQETGVNNIQNQLAVGKPLMADTSLAQKLKRALLTNGVNTSDLRITVVNGVAKIQGDLGSQKEADTTLSTALNVEGINNVESNLTVRGTKY